MSWATACCLDRSYALSFFPFLPQGLSAAELQAGLREACRNAQMPADR